MNSLWSMPDQGRLVEQLHTFNFLKLKNVSVYYHLILRKNYPLTNSVH